VDDDAEGKPKTRPNQAFWKPNHVRPTPGQPVPAPTLKTLFGDGPC
jgi:hypothetical protein